jgi:hypothetical protein
LNSFYILVHQMKVMDTMTGVETKIQGGKGQIQTEARYNALSCPRLAVQQAVMVEGIMGSIPDENKFNVDASTMIREDNGKNGTMYRIVSCEEADKWEKSLLKKPLTSIRFQSGLDMGLKWMLLDNGIGDFGKMVLILAVPGIPEGLFYAAKVQGMVFGEDSTKIGWIYFAKSRCMKGRSDEDAQSDDEEPISNAWSHYFKNAFIEDITHYANSYNTINPETDERFESVCTIDGENCIDRELLDPSVFTALSEAKIRVIKNRPSGTEFDNANDAADNFRDKNTGLKMCVQNNIDTSNPFLEKRLDEAYAQCKAAFPQITMTAGHWTKAKEAISRFVYVCRSKYVTSQKAVVGWRRTFQVRTPGIDLERPILGHENSTVDAYRLMKHLCLTPISDADMENIINHFPELIEIQKSEGRVDNVALDRLNICKLPPGEFKDRDALCLAQQGPVELTHRETRIREAAYAVRKETSMEQKKLEDARILVAATAEKTRKAEAAKVEKSRVALLSLAQKLLDPACVEQARVAKEKKAKTKESELAKAAKYQAACDLIHGSGAMDS